MKKAVAYIRVSSRSQEDNTSLDNQLNKIALTCQLEDLELVRVYRDVCSGKDIKNRPELNQMLSDIDSFDTVIVFKVDRLARSLINAVTIIETLQDKGKNLISVSEKISLDNPIGRLQFNMLMSFAEYERELIRDRIKSGKDETRAKGGFTGGQLRFGTRTEKMNNVSILVPDVKEQEIIKLIKNHKKSGKSLSDIALWLNSQGYTTKQGKSFTATQIKRVLDNEKTKVKA